MVDISLLFYLNTLKLNWSHIELLHQWDTAKSLKHKLLTDLEKYGYTYDGEITPKGDSLLLDVELWEPMEDLSKLRKPKEIIRRDPQFEEWLAEYPRGVNFEMGGKTFTGTRSLHNKVGECEVKYIRIAEEVGHEKLLACLKMEVLLRKTESVKRGENQLNWMKATLSYLNSRGWEPYIPLLNKKVEEDFGDRVKVDKIAY